jgi:hypothetical protein
MPLSFRQAGNLFVAGPNISIYPSGNTFAISGSASGGGIISGTNVGTAVGVFSGVVGTNMVFRTIRAGSNTGVFLSGNDIVFSATTGSINGVSAVTNIGGAIAVASAVTAGALISRTISGANGIEAVESGNLVLVRPSSTLTPNRFIYAGTGGALTTSDSYQVDSTNGTMALGFITQGDQLPILSRLSIAPGSASISQIRFTAFSARYTGATAGDIFYNSTSGNTLFFNKTTTLQTPFIFKDNNYSFTGTTNARILHVNSSGTINTIGYLTNLGIFNSLTSTTISGISELSVFNSGVTFLIGTNILNSSTHGTTPQLISGKKFRFNARGTITTSASSAGDLIASMKLGSVLVASSTTALNNNIPVNSFFEINTTFTIRAAGSSGNVIGSGYMLTDFSGITTSSNIASINTITPSGVTINTTNDAAFDFTLQNSTQPNNVYVINEATLEYLN